MLKQKKSIIALFLANLIPLLGVLFAGWNVFFILLIYWIENVIVGVINVFKMRKAEGTKIAKGKLNGEKLGGLSKKELIAGFIMNYGVFTLVHGIFVFSVFVSKISLLGLMVSTLFLVFSHLVSYYVNFIGNEEFKKISPSYQMFRPYKRMVILHVTIIFGGWVVMALSDSVYVMVLLVLFKILGDIYFHHQEHKGFDGMGINEED